MSSNTTKLKKRRFKSRNVGDFLMAMPVTIYLLIFTYYPIVALLYISFTNWSLLSPKHEWIGMKNWEWLFKGNGWEQFTKSLSVTVRYTVFCVLIAVVIGFIFALIFNEKGRKWGIMRSIIVLPKYISTSSTAVVFMWLMHENFGLLNYVIRSLGGENIRWLTSEAHALNSVILFDAWRSLGFAMILYIGAMANIPQDYYEAAEIDGANGFQKQMLITFPLLRPMTVYILLTNFLSSMKVFQTIDVMTGGGPYASTNVLVMFIYRLGLINFRIDRAATVSIVFFVILFVITLFTLRVTEKDMGV